MPNEEFAVIKTNTGKTLTKLSVDLSTIRVDGGRTGETLIHEANICRSLGEKIKICEAKSFAKLFIQTAHNVDYTEYDGTIVMSTAISKQFIKAVEQEVSIRNRNGCPDSTIERLAKTKTMAQVFANGKK